MDTVKNRVLSNQSRNKWGDWGGNIGQVKVSNNVCENQLYQFSLYCKLLFLEVTLSANSKWENKL